jgi:acetylornithine deacetylase/succinyl-diaminopimelate desuccinylase-like protein
VPDQQPVRVERLLRHHLAEAVPRTVRAHVRVAGGSRPVVVDRRHPAMHAAALAYEHAFRVPAVFLRSGGSIAAVGMLADLLDLQVVLMGFALPGDRPHSPNERVHLPTLFRGIDTCIWFLAELARSAPATSPAGTQRPGAVRQTSGHRAPPNVRVGARPARVRSPL